jgi:hypothetical protein
MRLVCGFLARSHDKTEYLEVPIIELPGPWQIGYSNIRCFQQSTSPIIAVAAAAVQPPPASLISCSFTIMAPIFILYGVFKSAGGRNFMRKSDQMLDDILNFPPEPEKRCLWHLSVMVNPGSCKTGHSCGIDAGDETVGR